MESKRNLKYYPCCEEPYPDIEFNFTVYRVAELEKKIVVAPITVVMLSTLASFLLPPQACEKVLIHGFDAVILVVFLKYFAEVIPDTTNHIPLIGKYK